MCFSAVEGEVPACGESALGKGWTQGSTFPLCPARANTAWDGDENLWPDPGHRQDAWAEKKETLFPPLPTMSNSFMCAF